MEIGLLNVQRIPFIRSKRGHISILTIEWATDPKSSLKADYGPFVGGYIDRDDNEPKKQIPKRKKAPLNGALLVLWVNRLH